MEPSASERASGKLRVRGQQGPQTTARGPEAAWFYEQALFAHSHTHGLLSLAAFLLQQLRGVVDSETIWPTKPEMFTLWPFTRRVCKSWVIDHLFQELCLQSADSGF